MASQEIQASSRGIKLPYVRFLADAATTFAAYAFLLFIYNEPIIRLSKDAPVFLALIVFLAVLIGSPIGRLITAVSWLSFSIPINWLETKWYDRDRGRYGTPKTKMMIDICKRDLKLRRNDWLTVSRLYETQLWLQDSELVERFGSVLGGARFARNLALLALLLASIYFICLLLKFSCEFDVLLFVCLCALSIGLILLSSRLDFRYYLHITFFAYLRSLEKKHDKTDMQAWLSGRLNQCQMSIFHNLMSAKSVKNDQ